MPADALAWFAPYLHDPNKSIISTLITIVNGMSNASFGQIALIGAANLDGAINATINYTPGEGHRIRFINSASSISGTFATENLPAFWSTDYSVGSEVALVYSMVLPIEMVYFNVQKIGKEAELNWQTASETNNEGFEVEHSAYTDYELEDLYKEPEPIYLFPVRKSNSKKPDHPAMQFLKKQMRKRI